MTLYNSLLDYCDPRFYVGECCDPEYDDDCLYQPPVCPALSPEVERGLDEIATCYGDTVTKTIRLRKATDGLELSLEFESPTADRLLVYRLDGLRGLPIEGEWYTSMFREVMIGSLGKPVETMVASDVVKKQDDPVSYGALPIKYAGVENQYYAVFFAPDQPPDQRRTASTTRRSPPSSSRTPRRSRSPTSP